MKIMKKTIAVFLVILTLFTTCSAVMPVFAENEVEDIIETNENAETEIVSEVIEKREENRKHFLMSDGSFMVAQYNNPVHYKNDDGQWIDYDNTIVEVEATTEQVELFGTDEIYSTGNITDNVVFAEKSNSNTLVSYEANDYPISLNYQSAKKSKIKIVENEAELTGNDAFLVLPDVTQEVLYEDVFSDVDLQYIVSPAKLKENIILKSSSAQNTFTVNYNIGDLIADFVDNKTVNLMAEEEIVYTITAPYMIDANGEKCEDIILNVDKNKNGKLRIDITADNVWLQAEERAYPVVIDPMIIEGDTSDINSTFISSGNPTANYGTSEIIYAASGSSEYGTAYALFDLGDFSDIGYDTQLISMKLNLNLSSAVGAVTYAYAYGITSQWDSSTVTWNTKPSVSAIAADYAKIASGTSTLSFDVTKLYNDMISGDEICYGLAVKMLDNGTLPITLAADNEPQITFSYINTAGLSDKYSYSEFDMGSAGAVHINNFSGNMILTRDDISTTGESYSYDLTSAYNSKTVYGDDSPRWVRSYQAYFTSIMMYIDEYGAFNFYNGTSSETESHTYILEENDQKFNKMTSTDFDELVFPKPYPLTGNYVIRYPIAFDVWSNDYTVKSHYTKAGLDSKIIDLDENGNGKTVFSRAYDYDENGEQIEGIFYIVDGDNDRLKIITTDTAYSVTQLDTKADGTVVEEDTLLYVYDANGFVTEIKYNGVTQGTFTYDENGLMTSVTNNDGYRLDFTYNTEQRSVTSVAESKNGVTGQKIGISRSYNKTVFKTAGADGIYDTTDDVETTYSFNAEAEIISTYASTVSGKDLSAVDYEYDKTNEKLEGFGGLSKVSASGISVNNLALNHNVESADNWTSYLLDDKNCSRTAEYTTEESYVGDGSLKINITDVTTTGGASFYQKFVIDDGVLEIGKTYTLSAFVKTNGITRDADAGTTRNHGASVMMRFVKNDGTNTRTYSHSVQKTNPEINNGWERVFVTFTVPEDTKRGIIHLVLRNGTGTVYFDGIQLEEGDAANAYNMVENNGFTYTDSSNLPVGWTRYLCNASDCVQNGQLKVVGSNTLNKAPLQEISLKNAAQSDTYILSGWAQADPVPVTGVKSFGLHALVFYNDAAGNTVSRVKGYKNFNGYDSGKQYFSVGFDLSDTDTTLVPVKIRVVLRYYCQQNTAYFDNVSLVKTSDVYDLAEQAESTEDTATAEEYSYNDDGSIATYTDENGVVYTYSYDSLGNITSILNSEGKGDSYTYYYYDTDNDGVNDDSDIKNETYEDGTVCTYVYGLSRNLETETIVSDGVTTVYTYNTAGQLITESETPGKTYTYSYDDYGNVVSKLDSDGNGDRYTYQYFDLNNNGIYEKFEVTYESLENGEENWYTYGDEVELTQMKQKKNGKELIYSYDSEGKITSVEHNGFSYNYTYDEFGNTTSVKVGEQNLVSYGYSSDKSKLSSLIYGNGLTERYTYDAYGQTVSKTLSDRGTANYYYNSLGNLLYGEDSVGGRNTYHQYDDDGNYLGIKVTTTADNVNDNVVFSSVNNVDEEGRIIKNILTANGFTSNIWYNYDENGLCTSSDLSSTRKINYTYDDQQRLIGRTLTTGTPVEETYSYTEDGVIASRTVTYGTNQETLSYTYDDNYNITEISKNGVLTQSYVYDEDNQLVRENNLDLNKTVTYTYDGYGNILSKNEYAYTVGELGTATDTVNYTYDTVWKDKLTSYDSEIITYDAIGNPTTYRGATLTWSGRQLMSYTKGDLNITYKYDANGLRTQKTVNGVVHDYGYDIENRLVYEKHGEEYEMFYRYDVDGRLYQVIRNMINNNNYKYYNYLTTNHFGDVIDLRDGNGTVYVKYNYDNWGKLISVTNANGVEYAADSNAHYMSIRYRGYVYDSDTGLYYLQSRYYDPETGRFLNADDVNYIGYSGEQLSYNAFAYCENNAVCRVDISGYSFLSNFLSSINSIMKKLIPIINLVNFPIENSSISNSINSMKRVYQTLNFNNKFNLYTLITVAETRKWTYTEKYSIITYSAKKKDWNNIINVVTEKYNEDETIKSKIVSLLLGGLSFHTKLQFIGYITYAAEIIGLAVDVFMMVLCEETLPIIKKCLKKLDDDDYYTFNWYIKYEYNTVYGNQIVIIYDAYSELAHYLGENGI